MTLNRMIKTQSKNFERDAHGSSPYESSLERTFDEDLINSVIKPGEELIQRIGENYKRTKKLDMNIINKIKKKCIKEWRDFIRDKETKKILKEDLENLQEVYIDALEKEYIKKLSAQYKKDQQQKSIKTKMETESNIALSTAQSKEEGNFFVQFLLMMREIF